MLRKVLVLIAAVCCLVAVGIDSTVLNWQHALAWLAAGVGIYFVAELTA